MKLAPGGQLLPHQMTVAVNQDLAIITTKPLTAVAGGTYTFTIQWQAQRAYHASQPEYRTPQRHAVGSSTLPSAAGADKHARKALGLCRGLLPLVRVAKT